MNANVIDITGERYGNLVAVCRTQNKTKGGGYKWLFRCDCGNEKEIPSNSVRSGLVKSCGCMVRKHGDTDGHKKSRLYVIWVNMHQRCKNKNNPEFKYWGGKGITVCEEWQEYAAFKKWAIENGYKNDLSIDRIDGNKGYTPDNCRWATALQQNRNQSSNHFITLDGKTKTLSEWIEISPITVSTYHKRKRKGMTDRDALFTPNRSNNHILKNMRAFGGDSDAES